MRLRTPAIPGPPPAGRLALPALLGAAALLLAACAAGPNVAAAVPGPEVAGFWQGLWHGLISPVTFVVSLLTDQVSVYEVHNTGNWYDAGFMLGVSAVFSGPLSARTTAARPPRARS